MDIRCGSCNKLFRVADDKVSGKGIRFKCSRCGEVITVTRDEAAAALAGPATAPSPAAATPSAPPAAPAAPPQPEPKPAAQEYQPQEYQPPVPPAGLDDFDFSEPHAATAAAGRDEAPAGGEAFSFEAPSETAGQESAAGGEISLSEQDQQEAEAGFQFSADIISEPARKPMFSTNEAAAAKEETGAFGEQERAPELTIEEERAPKPGAKQVPKPAVEEKPAAGLTIGHAAPSQEEEIDLGQALAIPKSVEPETPAAKAPVAKAAPVRPAAAVRHEEQVMPEEHPTARSESINPLASGNITGSIAGFGCALPVVLLALFAFGMMTQFVPKFSAFPRYHLLIVIGAGLVGLGVMTGMVIAIVQAQAGRKLFFLLNILIGSLFGALYGAGMNTVTSLAAGGGLNLPGIIAGAVSGAVVAFLLSLLISLLRRMMLFTKHESFAASLSGPQKAGIALSLVVILASLYAQGTLIGSMEKAGREIQRQFEEDVTPEGISVLNAHAYVDQATGDLIVSGMVQNGRDKEKEGWYLEVDVYDKDQKLLSTVKMLNGVQLYDQRDFDILAKRNRNIDELKAGMVMALQGGTIPAGGSVNFEMHLMDPPPGIASFYPVLKKYTFRESAGDDAPGSR